MVAAGQPGLAQVERYDPYSGRYIVSDPFGTVIPATPNPNRLNPRISRDITSPVGQGAGAQQVPSANGGTSAQGAVAPGQQFAPMGDMAMYGDSAVPDDPFAKPDWWPQ